MPRFAQAHDPHITARRHLCIFTYAIGYYEGIELQTHTQCLEILNRLGLPVEPHSNYKNIDEVINAATNGARRNLDYLVDGIVIKVNSRLHHRRYQPNLPAG